MGIDLKQILNDLIDSTTGPFFLAFLVLLFARIFRPKLKDRNKRTLPFPPGPKGLPFIGPVIQMPRSFEWVEFWRWGKVWGVYLFNSISDTYCCIDYRVLYSSWCGTDL
jgi:hypothetical protein